MNISDSLGESSSKQQENGDASSERPYKKARFAWQVKGKYHLRNETNNSTRPIAACKNEPDHAGTSSDNSNNSSSSFVGNTEQNLEILGDYLLKQDFNTLESVITDTDKSLHTPSTKTSTETADYPRYVSSCGSNESSANSTMDNYENENFAIPLSMVVSNSYCEDQCIARWQAKQMAKGFVDNTINRVLDSWTHQPLPPNMCNSRFLALDVAEFINNLPGADSIENEGILMAISAHGLQNTSGTSSGSLTPNKCDNINVKEDAFISPPTSPADSDEILQLESSEKQNDEIIPSDLSWTYADENMKKESAMSQFSFFPDNTNSCQFYDTNEHVESSMGYDSEGNSSSTHFDFMDAAVSFAIQNKGLTAFGTDYG